MSSTEKMGSGGSPPAGCRGGAPHTGTEGGGNALPLRACMAAAFLHSGEDASAHFACASPLISTGAASHPLSARRCWVVGCGFLGAALLAAARAAGMQALGIDPTAPAEVQGDAAQPEVLAAANALLKPELIFCCAATHGGDAAAYRATYVDVPRAVQAACPGARVVLCSSSSVYGGQGGEVVAESAACRADSDCARLLREAEESVLAAGGNVVRLVPLYGEGRCELLRRFVAREPELPGEEERWLNYIHVEDAARALLCVAAHALGGTCPRVVNACGESFRKGEVYAALSRLSGLPRVAQAAEGGRRGVANQRVSAELLRSLGWEPQWRFLDWAAGAL